MMLVGRVEAKLTISQFLIGNDLSSINLGHKICIGDTS